METPLQRGSRLWVKGGNFKVWGKGHLRGHLRQERRFSPRRKDHGFWIRKGGSMHNAWILDTIRAEAIKKSILSIKFWGVAWRKGSNGFAMNATRTTKRFHLGTRALQGGIWALSSSTATKGWYMAKNGGMLEVPASQMLQITQHCSDRWVKGILLPLRTPVTKGTPLGTVQSSCLQSMSCTYGGSSFSRNASTAERSQESPSG